MTFSQTWSDLVDRWYPGDPFRPCGAVRQYYETKWNIVCDVPHVNSIMEIGVRAGYSAFVFARAAPGVRYLGIDNGLCDAEARRDYLAHARNLLDGHDARWWYVDTGSLRSLPMGPDGDYWSLVHVDGHHSYEGCLHDLQCASAVAKRILVDDYDVGEGIRRACADFMAKVEGWRGREIHDGGVAGNLLLVHVG